MLCLTELHLRVNPVQMEAFFAQNGYVVLDVGSPEGLTSAEVLHWAAAFDADMKLPPWTSPPPASGTSAERGPGGGDVATHGWTEKGGTQEQTVNGDVLITSPEFDGLIRHPKIVGAIESKIHKQSNSISGWRLRGCL